jgi:Holliday junction resolvase RusA-like endonuclease
MTELTKDYAVRVYGAPVPQGSMTCVGHGGFHNVQPSNKDALKTWRALVEKAGRALPVTGLVGPLGVEVTFTVERPASVPLRKRAWPAVKKADVDKLARAVLDGLTESKVYGDDSQVVELTARKTYPDTPGATDRLDRPGCVIRLYPIGG